MRISLTTIFETEERRKLREHEKDLQRLRGLRPIDDDFMSGLFQDNIPLMQHVLSVLTGKSDLIIISVDTQADMKRLVGDRSVCLDAYGTDSTRKKYDLEVQRADNLYINGAYICIDKGTASAVLFECPVFAES